MTGAPRERRLGQHRRAHLVWATLALPLVAGLLAAWGAGRPRVLARNTSGIAPYDVAEEVYVVQDAQLYALDGVNPPRRVPVVLPPATFVSVDPSGWVYTGSETVLEARDTLTGRVELWDAGAPVVSGVAACRFVGLTADHGLVEWVPGAPGRPVPHRIDVLGVTFGRDCETVHAWTDQGVGLLSLATGDFELLLPREGILGARRHGEGWLLVDSDGVVVVDESGHALRSWDIEHVRSICGAVTGSTCVSTDDGTLWLLP